MNLVNNVNVITIDGPSGTGKGTLSHLLANYLGFHFLDSGAIYRVLALAAHHRQIDLTHLQALTELALNLNLQFREEDGKTKVYLDNINVTDFIREERCGQDASKIAALPEVREALLARQRKFAVTPGLVTDGRDMGTVVFPDAKLKIYLTASAEERAKRRYIQLQESKKDVSLSAVVDELNQRDERDKCREHAPLKPAEDAKIIDTTGLSIDQVFQIVLQFVKQSGMLI